MMLINPLYLLKAGENESQFLGGAFPNQKPSYLFSDIIKVTLTNVENGSDNNLKVSDNGDGANLGNMVSISDPAAMMFGNLMKVNFIKLNQNFNSDQTEGEENSDIKNVKMFLKGLANQDEDSLKDLEEINVDQNKLSVLLNLIAVNLYKYCGGDIQSKGFQSELKSFVDKVNDYLSQANSQSGRKVLIMSNEFNIELQKQNKNGKISITFPSFSELSDNDKELINSILNKEQLSTNNSETADSKPAENTELIQGENKKSSVTDNIQQAASGKKEISAELIEKPSNGSIVVKVKSDSSPKILNDNSNKTVASEKVDNSVEKNTNIKSTDNENTIKVTNKNPKITFTNTNTENSVNSGNGDGEVIIENQTKSTAVKNEVQVDTKQETILNTDKNVEKTTENTKSFLVKNIPAESTVAAKNSEDSGLKISNDPKNVQQSFDKIFKSEINGEGDNSNTELKVNSTNTEEFFEGKIKVEVVDSNNSSNKAEKIVEINNSTKIADTQLKSVNDNNKLQDVGKSTDYSGTEKSAKNNTATTKNELNNTSEKPSIKSATDAKPANSQDNQMQSVETKNTSVKVQNQQMNNQKQPVADVSTVNKNEADSKSTQDKNELEKIDSISEKLNKVTENKDIDQRKSDSRQSQNNFDKTTFTPNKVYAEKKEIFEKTETVDHSKLINKLESVIKAGDKKIVEFKLNPKDLGSVKVSLDVTNKQVTAKIEVANEAVRQMILNQSDSLKTSLSQGGIQLASLNVSVNSSGEKFTQNSKSKRKENISTDKISSKEVPTQSGVKNLGYNTYDYIV